MFSVQHTYRLHGASVFVRVIFQGKLFVGSPWIFHDFSVSGFRMDDSLDWFGSRLDGLIICILLHSKHLLLSFWSCWNDKLNCVSILSTRQKCLVGIVYIFAIPIKIIFLLFLLGLTCGFQKLLFSMFWMILNGAKQPLLDPPGSLLATMTSWFFESLRKCSQGRWCPWMENDWKNELIPSAPLLQWLLVLLTLGLHVCRWINRWTPSVCTQHGQLQAQCCLAKGTMLCIVLTFFGLFQSFQQ